MKHMIYVPSSSADQPAETFCGLPVMVEDQTHFAEVIEVRDDYHDARCCGCFPDIAVAS